MENTNEQGRIPYFVDFGWLVGLVALGVTTYFAWEKWKEFREAPIKLTSKPEGKMVTITIPEFWVQHTPGDTEESIASKYKPAFHIEGGEWVITIPTLTIEKGGASVSYTPPPVRVPLVPDMDVIKLAARLVPKVLPTVDPAGWKIQFPVITLEV